MGLCYYVGRQREAELIRQAERVRQAQAAVRPDAVAHVPRQPRAVTGRLGLRRPAPASAPGR
jgi:hypothetical protein